MLLCRQFATLPHADLSWGVPHVWLVDPYLRRLYTCDTGLTEVPSLALPEFGVTLTQADLFE